MSIIPGIEKAAPDRTETKSGSDSSPRRLPERCSKAARCCLTSSSIPPGKLPLAFRKARQASVVMVKPGGTGRPARVISATPAPLPPSSARISVPPSWKSYTNFTARRLPLAALVLTAVFAILGCLLESRNSESTSISLEAAL